MPLRLRSAGGGSVQLNSPVALATDVSMEVPAYAGAKVLTDKTPGVLLQVVNSLTTSQVTVASTTATLLELSITPKFASSKILIQYQTGYSDTINNANDFQIAIKRGGINGSFIGSLNGDYAGYYWNTNRMQWPANGMVVDTPNSAATLTYGVYLWDTTNVASSKGCSMILMEIAA